MLTQQAAPYDTKSSRYGQTLNSTGNVAGKQEEYAGEAVNPANLSWFEGLLGVGRPYHSRVTSGTPLPTKRGGPPDAPAVSVIANQGAAVATREENTAATRV